VSAPTSDPTTTESAPKPPPRASARARHRPPDPTKARAFGFQLAALPSLWLLLFLVLPVVVLLLWSLRPPGIASFTATDGFTLDAFRVNLGTPVFIASLGRTIVMVFFVAFFAVALSYPIAYLLARIAGPRRYVLLSLIVAPALISYLLRLFAWRSMLGSGGALNTVLLELGLTGEPLGFLLYNRFAVVVVLTYVWIPFAALPIFARLEQLNPNLLAAAQDLGASPRRTFLRVTLPLSLPGVYAGFFFVFIPTLGDFATAALVGGADGRMFGNIIRGVIGTPDYPSGAVLSIMLFTVAAASMLIAFRLLRIKDVSDLA
jgi:spermidine/putrescine transport system permease protein